ncbi:MAG: M48 family metallopeptidase [Planctomycetaceae bacterium]|nr:M48 family metallopeptidase [Planctomycetaceae bacterium]
MNRKILFLIVAVCLLTMFQAGCQVNPVTGEKQFSLVSPEEAKTMGLNYSKQIEKEMGESIKDEQLQNYINSVGQKIAAVSHNPTYGFTYKAIDHNSVNAFALPGGYIYITTGLLKELNSEAQLAGVLGHETAHVTARHIESQITNSSLMSMGVSVLGSANSAAGSMGEIVANLQSMSFSRADEKQADAIGLGYMVKAGYTPNGMIETMEILQKQSGSRTIEFFSTHPSPENRIGLLKEEIFNNRYPTNGKIGKEEYFLNVTARLKK